LEAVDPETFRYIWDAPKQYSLEGVSEFIHSIPEGRVALAAVSYNGEFFGSSSFFDVREEHLGIEIGHTWISKGFRGTFVNPEMKFLMLRHAFEDLGAIRVQLKTDARNEQSQAAMRKLGLTFEGVLRKHIVMPDGFIRDTVMFSVIDTEWPEVKAKLIERLGYEP
jgi:ribosomal-protein-alanine N-acetyltransferase